MAAPSRWLRAHLLLCICLLLVLGIVAFIFANSLENGEESMQTSDAVVEEIKPIVDPEDRIDDETFSFSVRKLAHFTEFFWLGMALCGVVIGASRAKDAKPLLSHPPVCGALLAALLTAVTDELIQSFTGRTSSVRDVLLDFFGAICGLALTALVLCLIRRISTKKTARRG